MVPPLHDRRAHPPVSGLPGDVGQVAGDGFGRRFVVDDGRAEKWRRGQIDEVLGTPHGGIAKTIYLLAYLDDDSYRRRILTQLNRTESRHALARDIFHGQRGQLRQRCREGQEDQLGALGLVVNAIVLWNTRTSTPP